MKKIKLLAIGLIAAAILTSNVTVKAFSANVEKKPEKQTTTVIKAPAKAAEAKNCPTCSKLKVATIDVQKIISNSPKLKALNEDKKNKMDEITAFVEKANASVAKETDPQKKEELKDKYNKELKAKKETLDKNYFQKLSEIDKEIKEQIKIKANASHYDLVLTKSSVLYGGTDITQEIVKNLK